LKLKVGSAELITYNVILMDYRLPGMDALELIKTLRQNFNQRIPIILVTGQGHEELAVQAMKLGANDYLTKSEKYLYKLPSVIINSYQHYELKRQQEILLESESKYRLLADNSGDVIFVLDMDLNYTYISPAIRLLRGVEPEEALKQKINEVLTPDSYQKVLNVLSEILSDKTIISEDVAPQRTIELEMFRKDQTTVWVEVKASLIRDKNNNHVGILGVTRDISEKKKMFDDLIIAKEKAEESDRLKTAFLANVSHEIRTPMNGILGFAELLKDGDLTGEEQNKYIKIIEQSGERMLNIINQIIDISKVESGLVELKISDTNINTQLERAYSFFKPLAEKKGIQLNLKPTLADPEAFIKTDREKLDAILLNLINNALKYTDQGEIEVGYEQIRKDDLDCLEFYIADTGIGIPKDRQKAVFDRFIQADVLDEQAREGAGLGLSISKAYVELMGGTMWVESEQHKGSTFYFTVPCSAI
jgi:PAS domain S-box-containing protein